MWKHSPLFGSSGGGVVATLPKLTYPSDRAGFNANPLTLSMASLAANTSSTLTQITATTLTSAIDGFKIVFTGGPSRNWSFSINDGTADVVSKFLLNTNQVTFEYQRVPIRIASGKTISIKAACETSNPGDVKVYLEPYTLDVSEVITQITALVLPTALSGLANGNGQTITMNGTTPVTGSSFSPLTAAAKGYFVHMGYAGDNSRPTSGLIILDILADGVLVDTFVGRSASNVVMFPTQPFIRRDFPSGTVFTPRVTGDTAGMTDNVNVNLVMAY